MKVYTKTGDDGTTALFGGDRVGKNHPRIVAYGTVDETNAAVGMARAVLDDTVWAKRADAILGRIQEELFVLGGDLASPGDVKYPVPRIEAHHVTALETEIDDLETDLPPLKHFILPGGHPAAATLHLARTVCRRAERKAIQAAESEDISAEAIHYLNRLSDFFFVLARWVNHKAGVADTEWVPVTRGAGRVIT
ncbi:MAG: cob(I)yrinic acid a,c-diamide adenosyltransferase [Bacteroidetes bacterium]|nr:cob(I)yrinic acid a,c-diamide adenosyltransferase [Bacteroidota bacterium]